MDVSPVIAKRAEEAGWHFYDRGSYVEVREGKKVLSFHKDPAEALKRAEERREEKKIQRFLKEGTSEPALKIPPKKNGGGAPDQRASRPAVETKPPVKVELPPDPGALMSAPPLPEYTPEQMGQAVANSIIKSKYKDKYKANGGSCGDQIADELREYLIKIVNGKAVVDLVKLEEVAKANEVWRESYRSLNVGQQRMNIGNRLRARYKEGLEINIGGVIIIDPEVLKA